MRSRQVVDAIEVNGTIASAPGGIEIQGNRVPLEDVAVVVIGNKTAVTGGAMSMLSKYDVVLLNADWRGVPNYVGYGWRDNSRIAVRHRKQAELSQPRRKAFWQALVKAKIQGQAFNLSQVASPAEQRLKVLVGRVRTGDPDNCEAQAARVYWSELFRDQEFKREPAADERINAMLNYGYAILRGFVIQGIAMAGLWPTLGIWHRGRSNTFCLADDLIEPFRPAVDARVAAFSTNDSLDDRQIKRSLVSVLSQPMANNSGDSVVTCIYNLAQDLARFVEGAAPKLVVPSWSSKVSSDNIG